MSAAPIESNELELEAANDIPKLVLGSSSKYRKALLERLAISFTVDSPDIDESANANESALDLCQRLALEKARAVALRHPQAWIIGSDQVALLGDKVYGKPGNHQRATQMLHELSGQSLLFHTALCLYDAAAARHQLAVVTVTTKFRVLGSAEIEHYLLLEQPYDCAGAAKSEGLGVTIMESVQSQDQTALVGLPLIQLCNMLRQWGMNLPLHSKQSHMPKVVK